MKRAMLAMVIFFAAVLSSGAIEVGETAPLFEAKDQDGAAWKLKEQNERMRQGMRRCTTCEYRLEVVGRR